jgi:gamma-glutamylcyclotransferase (GGCT)/AIG2-like uncharacterized protein YtfP
MVGAEVCLLFVYGTLRQASAHVRALSLRQRARYLGTARVRGRLYDLGVYPGLVAPAGPDDWVTGDLFELREPAATLAEMDHYEGCTAEGDGSGLYERKQTEVVREGGERLTAWVYVYCRPVREAQRIVSGDYLRDPPARPS